MRSKNGHGEHGKLLGEHGTPIPKLRVENNSSSF